MPFPRLDLSWSKSANTSANKTPRMEQAGRSSSGLPYLPSELFLRRNRAVIGKRRGRQRPDVEIPSVDRTRLNPACEGRKRAPDTQVADMSKLLAGVMRF